MAEILPLPIQKTDPPQIFVTTIMNDPGEIHISIAEGSGADTVILRKILTRYEMEQMHLKLTAALYFRLTDDSK